MKTLSSFHHQQQANTMSHLPRSRPTSGLSITALILFVIFAAACGAKASSSVTNRSPSEDVELICHTDNSADCYPKLFQATHEFQKVHKDQDIPPGLHVRLNVATGEREAKINDPNEKIGAVEGLPVDNSIVVVDSEEVKDEPIRSGAPAFEPVGMIKPPTDESRAFHDALTLVGKGVPKDRLFSLLKANQTAFDEALEHIEELAHDIYYGVKVTEDEDAMHTLLCLQSSEDVLMPRGDPGPAHRAQKASAIIAAALQNNPTALREVEKSWTDLMAAQCPGDDVEPHATLAHACFNRLLPPVLADDGDYVDPSPEVLKARLAAFNGLLKSDAIKKQFLESGTMTRILRILLLRGEKYENVHVKAAHLVMDNFLDENMGAKLGLWPKFKALKDGECHMELSDVSEVDEGCWDSLVRAISGKHAADEGHWSTEMSNMLRQRRDVEAGRGRDEL